MSSDMFSSMVEKDIVESEHSYKEIELHKWKQYAGKCKLRNGIRCKLDCFCDFNQCHNWDLINYIKFGIL